MLDATSSQVDPRNTARPPAAPRIGPGPAIEAAVVVAAIDGEARRDAVHPTQAALGVAVGCGRWARRTGLGREACPAWCNAEAMNL
jgi:hypothetical protein